MLHELGGTIIPNIPMLCLDYEGRRDDDEWDGSMLGKSLTGKKVVVSHLPCHDRTFNVIILILPFISRAAFFSAGYVVILP